MSNTITDDHGNRYELVPQKRVSCDEMHPETGIYHPDGHGLRYMIIALANEPEPLETPRELDEILEDLHQSSIFKGIVHDGKPHVMASHATGDSCITEAKAAITRLIAEEVRKAQIVTVSNIARIAGEGVGADPMYTFDAFAEDIAAYAYRLATLTNTESKDER
jgi:hypothetical protein